MSKLCEKQKLSTHTLRLYLLSTSWEISAERCVSIVHICENDKDWS